jgi:lambda family phage portal protein
MPWWNPRTWGRKALPAGRREYEAASQSRRMSDWQAGGKSANAEVALGGRYLRERSRDLVRNNAYAVAALRALVTNIVGEGIVPRSVGPSQAVNRAVDALWKRWAPKASAVLPIGVYGLQSLAVRSWLESGEVLLRRRRRRPEDGIPVPLQVQVIEADQLYAAKSEELGASGARIVQGVEFDAIERIVAYHVLRNHPGEASLGLRALSQDTSRVGAEDIAHLFEPTRPGQVRGVPWLTPGMRRFRDLDSYEDAEIMRKRVEACVTAIVYGDELEEEGIAAKVTDANGNIVETMEPGLIAYARGGKQIEFNSPSSVGGYAEFKRAEIQSIAAATGLTYELLSGDLSRVNYSSIRAGLIEFRRMVRQVRANVVIPMACDPLWRWFIEAGLASGQLPMPPAGVSIEDAYPVRWSAARFEEVDRVKEAGADEAELRNGTATLPQVLARRGEDWLDVLDEAERVKLEIEARGLSFPWLSGAASSTPPADAPAATPPADDVEDTPADDADDEDDATDGEAPPDDGDNADN